MAARASKSSGRATSAAAARASDAPVRASMYASRLSSSSARPSAVSALPAMSVRAARASAVASWLRNSVAWRATPRPSSRASAIVAELRLATQAAPRLAASTATAATTARTTNRRRVGSGTRQAARSTRASSEPEGTAVGETVVDKDRDRNPSGDVTGSTQKIGDSWQFSRPDLGRPDEDRPRTAVGSHTSAAQRGALCLGLPRTRWAMFVFDGQLWNWGIA
jgi:hypothetical protein